MQSGTKQTTLGEIAEFANGGAWNHEEYADDGVPVVRVTDIKEETVDLTSCKFLSNSSLKKYEKHQLRAGDLVICTVGSHPTQPGSVVGRAAIIPETADGALLNQNAVRLRALSKDVDQHWLGYLGRSRNVHDYIISCARGSANQVRMAIGLLKEMPVDVPPLSFQRRIAGILSAYDDLIENNQRRIKILEEIARSLYREWFVNFRFPGHEKVPLVDSPLGPIPKGWEVKALQEIADVIDCLHSKKPAECAGGQGVLLQLNNIGEAGKLDMCEQFRISADDYELWTSRIELRTGDCVVTNVGRVGAVAQIPEGVTAAPGRNMTAIRARAGKLTPSYLIQYLLSSHMTSEVAKKKDFGTIMDSLNVKGIIRLHVPCPPIEMMLRFEGIARPIRHRIELFVEQIQNLRRTRDLLLPRLLNGD